MTEIQTYPNREEVKKANIVQMLRWNRQLRSPATPQERSTLDLITDRLVTMRDEAPEAYTAASKEIGW